MTHDFPIARTSLPRRARILTFPALLLVGALALVSCATPSPGAAPAASATAVVSSPPAASSPTASSTPATVAPDPDPAPSADPPGDAPYNGEILVVTSEIRDQRLEVTAMVPAVSESTGTCTLTLEGTGEAVSVGATEGNDVTYCGLMSIPVNSDGSVSFRVGYSSPTTAAQSAVAQIGTAP